MNEYSISDYGIFSDAITTTNDCSSKVSSCKDGVTSCKTVISDEGVFMGPIQEKCIAALTGVDTDCGTIISSLGSMSNYLISTSVAYQKGDQDAQNAVNAPTDGVTSSTLGNNSFDTQTLLSSGKMYTYQHNGKSFNVTNTRIKLDDYASYIQKNGMYQNAGFLGGQCMLLSQYYASDMIRGKYTTKNVMAQHGGSPAVKMNERCATPNAEPVLQYMYQELSQGQPVVLQVTQKRSNEGLRHLVTAVGYSSDVKSYADLTPDKILVLDCVDGKVQTLSERNRKLYKQGKNFQALGATERFLASVTPTQTTTTMNA